MNLKQLVLFGASALTLGLNGTALSDESPGPFVRVAELDIDPAQLEGFRAAIREGIETAVRLEPGVLVLYAVAEKDNPARIHVFEVYVDAKAYATHLETPHFRKFRDTTDRMVVSRKLLDAVPIALGAQAK